MRGAAHGRARAVTDWADQGAINGGLRGSGGGEGVRCAGADVGQCAVLDLMGCESAQRCALRAVSVRAGQLTRTALCSLGQAC
jgi:hypothetical protein